MLPFPSHISILLLLSVYATTTHISMCSSNQRVVRCNDKDQRPLSIFKQGLIDPFNSRLSTWSTEKDCCAWKGVHCDNTTGRVTSLDLQPKMDDDSELEGEIKLSWLLQLEFLNYLDLSGNNFTSVSIPPIHHNITNTTTLHYLDLSGNYYVTHKDNLQWLSQLPSLKYLSLNSVNLQKEANWLHIVAMLPSLSELYLTGCGLTNIYPSHMYVNFTSLVTLDLSYNHFNSKLPHWLFNLSSGISNIFLYSNDLYGEIPSSLLNLPNLKVLYLSWNRLNGSIPNWLGQHEHLQSIDISHNFLSGSIPSSLENLSSLIDLDISSNLLRGNLPDGLRQLVNLSTLRVRNNSLSGVLSEMVFSNLSNLQVLDLSNTDFEFKMDKNWIPSFQLVYISLSNTVQGPDFPAWLYTQSSLSDLHISSAGISSVDEELFPIFVARIRTHLDLSNNSITADLSNLMLYSPIINLAHNYFMGMLPQISVRATYVDVSHNSFTGGFPNSWENLEDLSFLNVESNNLTGNLPIRMSPNLQLLILRSNSFEGNIPPQLCYLPFLHILDLANNKLSGSIPQCVHNMTQMVWGELDIGNTIIAPTFDLIMKGHGLKYHRIGFSRAIDLSNNTLSGVLPPELFKLVKIQSLNLSHNHLTGTIPKTIGDMKNVESLDLSYNQFTGEIPQNISTLNFLSLLNLSYNHLSGQIPLGSQLQTFDAWSYVGNPKLCGAPLTKTCTEKENQYKGKRHAGDKDGCSFTESLYLGMGVGFAIGFWGVCGSLFLNRTWRHTYFRFVNHVADRTYVIVALRFRNFGGGGASLS